MNCRTHSGLENIDLFFTPSRRKARPRISLRLTGAQATSAPTFHGTFDGIRVIGYIRHPIDPTKRAFLVFVDPRPGGDGKPAQVATGNLVVTNDGTPKLALKLTCDPDKTVWVQISPQTPEALLREAGLDFDRMPQRKS